MEVFLYRCDRCGTVIALNGDRGAKFYIDQCTGCKEWADFEKVVVAQNSNMYKESSFFVVEEKEDDKEE